MRVAGHEARVPGYKTRNTQHEPRNLQLAKGAPMTAEFALTPAQVKKAVETVIQKNPIYAEMLGFYGRLFVA